MWWVQILIIVLLAYFSAATSGDDQSLLDEENAITDTFIRETPIASEHSTMDFATHQKASVTITENPLIVMISTTTFEGKTSAIKESLTNYGLLQPTLATREVMDHSTLDSELSSTNEPPLTMEFLTAMKAHTYAGSLPTIESVTAASYYAPYSSIVHLDIPSSSEEQLAIKSIANSFGSALHSTRNGNLPAMTRSFLRTDAASTPSSRPEISHTNKPVIPTQHHSIITSPSITSSSDTLRSRSNLKLQTITEFSTSMHTYGEVVTKKVHGGQTSTDSQSPATTTHPQATNVESISQHIFATQTQDLMKSSRVPHTTITTLPVKLVPVTTTNELPTTTQPALFSITKSSAAQTHINASEHIMSLPSSLEPSLSMPFPLVSVSNNFVLSESLTDKSMLDENTMKSSSTRDSTPTGSTEILDYTNYVKSKTVTVMKSTLGYRITSETAGIPMTSLITPTPHLVTSRLTLSTKLQTETVTSSSHSLQLISNVAPLQSPIVTEQIVRTNTPQSFSNETHAITEAMHMESLDSLSTNSGIPTSDAYFIIPITSPGVHQTTVDSLRAPLAKSLIKPTISSKYYSTEIPNVMESSITTKSEFNSKTVTEKLQPISATTTLFATVIKSVTSTQSQGSSTIESDAESQVTTITETLTPIFLKPFSTAIYHVTASHNIGSSDRLLFSVLTSTHTGSLTTNPEHVLETQSTTEYHIIYSTNQNLVTSTTMKSLMSTNILSVVYPAATTETPLPQREISTLGFNSVTTNSQMFVNITNLLSTNHLQSNVDLSATNPIHIINNTEILSEQFPAATKSPDTIVAILTYSRSQTLTFSDSTSVVVVSEAIRSTVATNPIITNTTIPESQTTATATRDLGSLTLRETPSPISTQPLETLTAVTYGFSTSTESEFPPDPPIPHTKVSTIHVRRSESLFIDKFHTAETTMASEIFTELSSLVTALRTKLSTPPAIVPSETQKLTLPPTPTPSFQTIIPSVTTISEADTSQESEETQVITESSIDSTYSDSDILPAKPDMLYVNTTHSTETIISNEIRSTTEPQSIATVGVAISLSSKIYYYAYSSEETTSLNQESVRTTSGLLMTEHVTSTFAHYKESTSNLNFYPPTFNTASITATPHYATTVLPTQIKATLHVKPTEIHELLTTTLINAMVDSSATNPSITTSHFQFNTEYLTTTADMQSDITASQNGVMSSGLTEFQTAVSVFSPGTKTSGITATEYPYTFFKSVEALTTLNSALTSDYPITIAFPLSSGSEATKTIITQTSSMMLKSLISPQSTTNATKLSTIQASSYTTEFLSLSRTIAANPKLSVLPSSASSYLLLNLDTITASPVRTDTSSKTKSVVTTSTILFQLNETMIATPTLLPSVTEQSLIAIQNITEHVALVSSKITTMSLLTTSVFANISPSKLMTEGDEPIATMEQVHNKPSTIITPSLSILPSMTGKYHNTIDAFTSQASSNIVPISYSSFGIETESSMASQTFSMTTEFSIITDSTTNVFDLGFSTSSQPLSTVESGFLVTTSSTTSMVLPVTSTEQSVMMTTQIFNELGFTTFITAQKVTRTATETLKHTITPSRASEKVASSSPVESLNNTLHITDSSVTFTATHRLHSTISGMRTLSTNTKLSIDSEVSPVTTKYSVFSTGIETDTTIESTVVHTAADELLSQMMQVTSLMTSHSTAELSNESSTVLKSYIGTSVTATSQSLSLSTAVDQNSITETDIAMSPTNILSTTFIELQSAKSTMNTLIVGPSEVMVSPTINTLESVLTTDITDAFSYVSEITEIELTSFSSHEVPNTIDHKFISISATSLRYPNPTVTNEFEIQTESASYLSVKPLVTSTYVTLNGVPTTEMPSSSVNSKSRTAAIISQTAIILSAEPAETIDFKTATQTSINVFSNPASTVIMSITIPNATYSKTTSDSKVSISPTATHYQMSTSPEEVVTETQAKTVAVTKMSVTLSKVMVSPTIASSERVHIATEMPASVHSESETAIIRTASIVSDDSFATTNLNTPYDATITISSTATSYHVPTSNTETNTQTSLVIKSNAEYSKVAVSLPVTKPESVLYTDMLTSVDYESTTVVITPTSTVSVNRSNTIESTYPSEMVIIVPSMAINYPNSTVTETIELKTQTRSVTRLSTMLSEVEVSLTISESESVLYKEIPSSADYNSENANITPTAVMSATLPKVSEFSTTSEMRSITVTRQLSPNFENYVKLTASPNKYSTTSRRQSYSDITSQGQSYTATTSLGQSHSATTLPGQSYSTTALPGQSYSATTSLEQSYSATALPEQAYTPITSTEQSSRATASPGELYSATTSLGQSYTATISLAQSFSATALPGQSYSATASSRQSYNATFSPAQLYSATTSPGQSYKTTASPGQSYTATALPEQSYTTTLPGQSYSTTALQGQSYSATTSLRQSSTATTSPGESYSATASSRQSYNATISPGQLYSAITSPTQLYSATTSIGQSYSATTSPGQSYSATTSIGQLYSATTSPGQSYSATTSTGQFYSATTTSRQSYSATISPAQSYTATASPGQSYTPITSPGQSYTATALPEQSYSTTALQGQSYSAITSLGQSSTAAASPEESYSTTASSRQSYNATITPGQLYGGTTSPGQSYKTTASPGQLYTATASPGQSYNATITPGQLYGGTTSPTQSYTATASPGQLYTATASPGQSYTATALPEQSYSTTALQGQSYSATTSPGQSSTAAASPEESYSTTASSRQSYNATITPGQLYGGTTSPGQSYKTTASPGQLYTATASPGQSYTATTSPTQSYTATASPTQSYTATASPGQSYTATASTGQSYTATTSPTQSYTATASPTQSYTATASSGQSYTATVSPGNSYNATASPEQFYSATTSQGQSYSATISSRQLYTATTSLGQSYSATASSGQSHMPTTSPGQSHTLTTSQEQSYSSIDLTKSGVSIVITYSSAISIPYNSMTITPTVTATVTSSLFKEPSYSATTSSRQLYTAATSLGQSYSATASSGQSYSAITSPGQSYSAITSPGQSYSATASSRQSYSATASPEQSYSAITSPGQSYSATASSGQSYSAITSPGQSYSATASSRQSYSATASPEQSYSAITSPGQSYSATASSGQSYSAITSPGQSYSATISSRQSYSATASPEQSYSAITSPGQSYSATASSRQSYSATASPEQSYSAITSPGQSYSATASSGQSYSAITSPGQSYSATASSRQSYSATASPEQSYSAITSPGQSYSATASSRQSHNMPTTSPDQSHTLTTSPERSYSAIDLTKSGVSIVITYSSAISIPYNSMTITPTVTTTVTSSLFKEPSYSATTSSRQLYMAATSLGQSYSATASSGQSYSAITSPGQSYSAITSPGQSYSATASPERSYSAITSPGQSYSAITSPGQSYSATASPEQSYSAITSPEQSYSATASSGQSYSAITSPGQSYSATASPEQSYSAITSPGESYSAITSPGQSYSAITSPEQSYSATAPSGQSYSAITSPGQSYSATASSRQSYSATASPEQSYSAITSPGQSYSAITSPGQSYSATASSRQSYSAITSPGQSYSATASPEQSYSAITSPEQSYSATASSGQSYSAITSPGQSYSATASPEQSYSAITSPGESYSAITSPGQSYSAITSPEQSYSATAPSGQSYSAITSPGQSYSATASSRQSYSATASPEQSYSAITSPGQSYSAITSPGQSYSATASSRQSYSAITSPGQSYSAIASSRQSYSATASPEQSYSAITSPGQSYSATASSGQSYSAITSPGQSYSATASSRQSYSATASPEQSYSAITSPGQSYSATASSRQSHNMPTTSPDQSHTLTTLPEQSYSSIDLTKSGVSIVITYSSAISIPYNSMTITPTVTATVTSSLFKEPSYSATTSSRQLYTAATSLGQSYSATASSGQSYSAITSPEQSYSATASSGQSYSAITSPGQSYSATASSRQSHIASNVPASTTTQESSMYTIHTQLLTTGILMTTLRSEATSQTSKKSQTMSPSMITKIHTTSEFSTNTDVFSSDRITSVSTLHPSK